MRSGTYIFFALAILGALVAATNAQAQSSTRTHQIFLYAHSYDASLILNASPPTGLGESGNVSDPLAFTLSPALGEKLRIQGEIIYTVNLRASASSSGTVSAWLSELKPTGEEAIVTGTNASTMVLLSNRTQTIAFGIGPSNYEFQNGSFIRLSIRAATTSSVLPELAWDEAANASAAPPLFSTSVRLSVVDPTRAAIGLLLPQQCQRYGASGTIIRMASSCLWGEIYADVTDSIGVYRFSDSMIVTFPNQTRIQMRGDSVSDHVLAFSYNTTLVEGHWDIGIKLLDGSGNSYAFDYEIWVTRFYEVRLTVTDEGGDPLPDTVLSVTDTQGQGATWIATTGSTGSATVWLPSSSTLGPLNRTFSWHNSSVAPQSIEVFTNMSFRITLPVFDVGLRPLMSGMVPLPNSIVVLRQDHNPIANATTGIDGVANFKLFTGNYTAEIGYLWSQSECSVVVKSNGIVPCTVPVPTWLWFSAVGGGGICAVIVVAVFVRGRTRLKRYDFSYFDRLIMDGLPSKCFIVITGNTGSGKTVLLGSLAIEHLLGGQSCVYITNTEHPSETREHLGALGLPRELAGSRRLLFVDSYSAISRIHSTEEFQVSSHTNLTALGIEITKCLEQLGTGADIYIDSLTPMLASLRSDSIIPFLQYVDSKAKAIGGKLCVTVGVGIDKADLTKLEEISDCVIETAVQESRKGQRRRLRVKKVRGRSYIDKWTTYRVERGKGIVFLARAKRSQPQ